MSKEISAPVMTAVIAILVLALAFGVWFFAFRTPAPAIIGDASGGGGTGTPRMMSPRQQRPGTPSGTPMQAMPPSLPKDR